MFICNLKINGGRALKIIILVLSLFMLFVFGISIYKIFFTSGKFNVNPEANFGLAIDQYLVETKWTSYENNDGRIVQIIGKKRDVALDHTYTYELNYLLDRKNNTYTLYSAYKDGIKMNAVEELILKIKAFDLCDVDIE